MCYDESFDFITIKRYFAQNRISLALALYVRNR